MKYEKRWMKPILMVTSMVTFNPKRGGKKYWTEGNKGDRGGIVGADAAVFDNFHCEVLR